VVYPECVEAAECDDGLYCNGAEDCVAGSCVAGTPVTCDDGIGCTDDSCNETTDSCDYVPDDANCDNGVACDGIEVCDSALDCLPGISVDFSTDTYGGSECGGDILITVELSSATCETVRVKYATIDETARQPDDYAPVSGTLTFQPGETRKTFCVRPVEDAEREGDETVTLALSNPSGAALAGLCNPATLIISDPREVEVVRYTTTRYGYCGAFGAIPPMVALLGMLAWKSTNRCGSHRVGRP
jgi:hypothetical protein